MHGSGSMVIFAKGLFALATRLAPPNTSVSTRPLYFTLGRAITLDIILHYIISRIIALPSVKYNCPVETDVIELRDLGVARRVASQPVKKITIDPEPHAWQCCGRSNARSLRDCCLCLQHIFKDQPWLPRVSGDTRSVARNSQAYRSNVPSVNSVHISTHIEATQTLLTWEL